MCLCSRICIVPKDRARIETVRRWVSKDQKEEGPLSHLSALEAQVRQTDCCEPLTTVQFCQIRLVHQSAYFQKGTASYRSMMTTSLAELQFENCEKGTVPVVAEQTRTGHLPPQDFRVLYCKSREWYKHPARTLRHLSIGSIVAFGRESLECRWENPVC